MGTAALEREAAIRKLEQKLEPGLSLGYEGRRRQKSIQTVEERNRAAINKVVPTATQIVNMTNIIDPARGTHLIEYEPERGPPPRAPRPSPNHTTSNNMNTISVNNNLQSQGPGGSGGPGPIGLNPNPQHAVTHQHHKVIREKNIPAMNLSQLNMNRPPPPPSVTPNVMLSGEARMSVPFGQ